MRVHRSSVIFKGISISLVLLGSVAVGYGQSQTPPQREPQLPTAGASQDAGKDDAPQVVGTSPEKSQQPQANKQNQTTSSPRPAPRQLESVPRNGPHYRGTVVVGAGFGGYPYRYRRFGGPFIGFGFGYYPYRYYSPYFYGPYYGPYYPSVGYYGGYYGHGYGRGEIKLSIDPGYARVYVDGAFAGRAADLEHMYLEPGTYDISISAPGRETYNERVYVLSGKKLKIKLALEAARPVAPPPPEDRK